MMDRDDKRPEAADSSPSAEDTASQPSDAAEVRAPDAASPPAPDDAAPATDVDAAPAADAAATPGAATDAPDAPATAAAESDPAALDDLETAWTAASDAPAPLAPTDDDDDEIDPELLRLPRPPRRRRHPLISVVVIAMSIYLLHFGWVDVSYFFESNTPRDLGEVSELIGKAQPPTNTYVTLRGAPDRKHALLLQGRVSGYESFFRLREGRNLFYVQQHRAGRASQRTISAEHAGRLVSFGSLPYRDAVRQYFAKNMTVAHDLDFADLQRAKSGKEVIDKQGLKVDFGGNKLFWINVSYPKEWLLQFAKGAYKTRADAAAQLASLKLPYAPEDEPSPSFWRFVVLADDTEAKQLMNVFRSPKLHAGVLRRQVSYSAKWAQLRIEGERLTIDAKDDTFPSRFVVEGGKLLAKKPSPVTIDRAALRYITTSSKYTIPDHAVVLLAAEVPHDKWLYLLLYLILGAFIAFNVLAIVQRLRQR